MSSAIPGRVVAAMSPLLLTLSAAHGQWTAINLNPTGWTRTKVWAVTPTRQFGEGATPAPPYPSTFQALGWSGSASSMVVMSPGPGNGGIIYGASGAWQVGIYTGGHAALWNGVPGPPVDLHPAGYFHSAAIAIVDDRQFGYVQPTSNDVGRAAQWSGSASSYVDLHPAEAQYSVIGAAWGQQQGGTAAFGTSLWPFRAGIWSGTAQSFASMHPGFPYLGSSISGMAEGVQVGIATGPSGFDHAGLWRGTAASFVDLDPGWDYSRAFATCDTAQVGWTTLDFSNTTHAVIWFGTAASYHPLSQYLPAGYTDSVATSIASDGEHYYVGGYAKRLDNGTTDAFLWIGPGPSSCYANCDGSTTPPRLTVGDFACFLQRFGSGESYANCDGSTTAPVLNLADFTCFLQAYAAGCS